MRSTKHQKVIQRHVYEDLRDEAREFFKTNEGQYLAQRRRETVERSFADSKELHGLRYARYRGRKRVQHQCLMSALAPKPQEAGALTEPVNFLRFCSVTRGGLPLLFGHEGPEMAVHTQKAPFQADLGRERAPLSAT